MYMMVSFEEISSLQLSTQLWMGEGIPPREWVPVSPEWWGCIWISFSSDREQMELYIHLEEFTFGQLTFPFYKSMFSPVKEKQWYSYFLELLLGYVCPYVTSSIMGEKSLCSSSLFSLWTMYICTLWLSPLSSSNSGKIKWGFPFNISHMLINFLI